MKSYAGRSRTPLIATLAIIALAGIGFGLWKHFREGHKHDHGNHEAHAALSLNDGKRWAADAPLQTGMQRIRDAATPVLAAHAQRRVTPDQAKSLATTIQDSANFLMQNCKLEPKADATLHVFLTDLLRGSALLAAEPGSAEGATLIAEALQRYPEYFDHPGWIPVSASKT
jgi:hypothetical protein